MTLLILIVSAGLLVFYLQATCQTVLRREFDHEFFHAVVNANRLEFPFVRKALEQLDLPVDPRFGMQLCCDFFALTYLLKNACNARRRLSNDERLLWIYFHAVFLVLVTAHTLRFEERPLVVKLTAILEYFANVLGQRLNTIRFGDMTASDYTNLSC
jgi:hypothetical protein